MSSFTTQIKQGYQHPYVTENKNHRFTYEQSRFPGDIHWLLLKNKYKENNPLYKRTKPFVVYLVISYKNIWKAQAQAKIKISLLKFS